jgi:hypothetical protein
LISSANVALPFEREGIDIELVDLKIATNWNFYVNLATGNLHENITQLNLMKMIVRASLEVRL